VYAEVVYTPEWRAQRERAATQSDQHDAVDRSLTANELWRLVWPELYDQVELDLAVTGLIPNLEHALDTRPWHFTRAAIERLPDVDGTWVRKAVTARVRSRRSSLPNPIRRSGDLQEGPG
jgi:hypothetical protein